jgi:hypothetical protein
VNSRAQADGRGLLDECHSVRLEVTAQALHAVRAFDMAAANQIQAELAFALGVRQPGPGLAANAQAQVNRLSHVPPGPGAGQHWPPAPPGPWRVVPASQVIRHPDGDVAGELWLRGRDGRWHTARPVRSAPLRDTDDYMLWLRVVPPLDYGTADVDVVVTGPSAEVQVRLPLSWHGRP